MVVDGIDLNDVQVTVQPELSFAFRSLDGADPGVVLAEAVGIPVQVYESSTPPR